MAFERWLRLRDGRNVWVRPILPYDAPELAEAIHAADADTLRRRFLGSPPRLTPKLLRWLITVDYVRRFVLVALDPATGRGIAFARFEPLAEEGVAEVAVAVDPAWRRVGLATRLVQLLAEAAVEQGVHSFGASYLAQNRPVEAIIAHSDGAKLLISHGGAELPVTLDHWSGGAGCERLTSGDVRHVSTCWGTNRALVGLSGMVVDFVFVSQRSQKRCCGRFFPYLAGQAGEVAV